MSPFDSSYTSHEKISLYKLKNGYFCATIARVVEVVDTKDLKSFDHCGRAGSSPASGTVNPS